MGKIVCVHPTSKNPLKLAPVPSRLDRQALQILGKLNFKANKLLFVLSNGCVDCGLWFNHRSGVQTREGEKRRLAVYPDSETLSP